MTRNNLMPAIVLLLAATLSWGGMFPVAKPLLDAVDPYYMTLIRYGATAAILITILVLTQGISALSLEGKSGWLLFLGSLGFAGFNLLAFNGLLHAKPEHGAVIMALQPMLAVLLTWLLKGTRPHAFTLGAIIAAFIGVFLVITGGDPARAFAGGEAQWDLMFLAGALCWVSYTLGAQSMPHWSPLRYTAITAMLGSGTIAVITLVLTAQGTLHAPTLATLASWHWTLAYLIIPGGVVAALSWNAGIKMLGAINGVLFINFVPITAFVIGVISGRDFSAAEITGAILVIGALIANNLYLRHQTRRARKMAATLSCA